MWKWGKLELSWGFPVLLAAIALAGTGEVLPAAALSALGHELGHLLALRLAGARVERVKLTAFGAEIRADTRYLSYPREILCTLAGPAVNLVLAVLLGRIAGAYVAAGVNLTLGIFNLLPVPALDGGRVLHLLVSWSWDPMAADRVSRWVGLGSALLLTAGALWVTLRYQAGLFLLLGAAGTLLPQLPVPARREPE